MKWFDKLPAGSIENFYQLIELFVTRFVINTKTSKGVGSFLTLRKGKNELIQNSNKLKECYEELAMESYKFKLTHKERL